MLELLAAPCSKPRICTRETAGPHVQHLIVRAVPTHVRTEYGSPPKRPSLRNQLLLKEKVSQCELQHQSLPKQSWPISPITQAQLANVTMDDAIKCCGRAGLSQHGLRKSNLNCPSLSLSLSLSSNLPTAFWCSAILQTDGFLCDLLADTTCGLKVVKREKKIEEGTSFQSTPRLRGKFHTIK